MDLDPLRMIAGDRGFFTRPEAKNAGHSDVDITRLVRNGTWVRIRRGAYVFADSWALSSPVARHAIHLRAVLHSLGDRVAASHISGVVAHGIDTWRIPLDRIHVTRLDGGAGRLERDVVHHEGFCDADDLARADGLSVLRAERCVLEAASRADPEAAFCLLESGLRSGLFTPHALRERQKLMQHWPFMHRLMPWMPLASGDSGSVGESRGIWLFAQAGLPMPVRQFKVYRRDGSLAGIADWAWPELKTLGEFDGRAKYGRALADGQDPGDAVFREKTREDELRELTGMSMIRLTWPDYDRPAETVRRLLRGLRLTG